MYRVTRLQVLLVSRVWSTISSRLLWFRLCLPEKRRNCESLLALKVNAFFKNHLTVILDIKWELIWSCGMYQLIPSSNSWVLTICHIHCRVLEITKMDKGKVPALKALAFYGEN